MTLRVPRSELSKILRHSAEAYPEECCGFLIGIGGPSLEVFEARRATNVHAEDRHTRYTVDPREQLRVEQELSATRREVIGFCHSHPDHPGRPSAFALERSWPGYAYLIVEDRGDKALTAHSFRMDSETKTVREERVSVTHHQPAKSLRPNRGPPREHGRRKGRASGSGSGSQRLL